MIIWVLELKFALGVLKVKKGIQFFDTGGLKDQWKD